VQPVPRPPASVPLGGSLRASRAAQLAAPSGPLAAVDLADGRPLVAGLRGAAWVEVEAGEATLVLPAPLPEIVPAPPLRRRRRTGTALALAATLGAAGVVLATGLSGAPPPAVAGPVAPLRAPRLSAHAQRPLPARGGRAAAPLRPAPVRPAAPAVAPVAAPPPVAASPSPPLSPPAPPPLPELPAAPAL
jgi:hypothetical protein